MVIIQIHKDKDPDIENNYNEQLLAGDLEHIEQSLQKLQEIKERIVRQLEKIKTAKFREEVHIERLRSYDRSHIEYLVNLHAVPEIPELDRLQRAAWASPAHFLSGTLPTVHTPVHYPITQSRVFPGKERKEAREYARKLAEAHEAKVVEK